MLVVRICFNELLEEVPVPFCSHDEQLDGQGIELEQTLKSCAKFCRVLDLKRKLGDIGFKPNYVDLSYYGDELPQKSRGNLFKSTVVLQLLSESFFGTVGRVSIITQHATDFEDQ